MQSFLVLIFTLANTRATSFTCNVDQNQVSTCARETLRCDHNETCSLICGADGGCLNTSLTCAPNQLCTVICTDAAHEQSCWYMKIDGNDASFLFVDIGRNEMSFSQISCPRNGNCTILADYDGCKDCTISGKRSNYMNVTATVDWAYRGSIINGLDADFLYVGALDFSVIRYAQIYCPDNGPKLRNDEDYACIIDTGTAGSGGRSALIYAVEGFNDVLLTGSGFGLNLDDVATLYCTEYYNQSCVIDGTNSSDIHCNASSFDISTYGGSFCDTYLLPNVTDGPTTMPTTIPTEIPTIPTTAPSFLPSTEPSVIPSSIPTRIPTRIPTTIPTRIPTTVPVYNQSQIS